MQNWLLLLLRTALEFGAKDVTSVWDNELIEVSRSDVKIKEYINFQRKMKGADDRRNCWTKRNRSGEENAPSE